MAYPQPFGYACPTVPSSLPGSIPPSLPSSQLLMSASGSPQTPTTVPTSCCESGRPIMTDPNTGQTVCSCQYAAGSAASLLPYSRVAGLPDSVYSSAYAAQGYMPFGTDPSAFYSPLNSAYDLKDGSDAWRSLAHPTPCYPYDPTMGAGYPYGQSALAQRKNATREATSTLKAWLQEHIKNPYPTKGEKIMLAIITKMTLTQVSTWFANARRRLKKENKMTWSPRNRTDEDGNKIDSDDEDDKNDDDKERDDSKTKDDDDELIDAEGRDSVPLNICVDDSVSDILSDGRTDSSDKKDESRFSSCGVRSGVLPPTQVLPSSPMSIINTSPPIGNCMSSQDSNSQKPRIWSLADVATSSSPPEAARGPPPINPKLGNPLDSSRYSPVSSFRPWVNGAHPHPYGAASAPPMPSSNPSGSAVPPGAPNPQGLLRPYSLVARPEVH